MLKRKYMRSALLLVMSVFLMGGCGKKSLPEVTLSVWCDERNSQWVTELVDRFKEQHADEAVFNITISEESELTCKETVLADPKAAADIYTFADDQFEELWRGGALLEITDNARTVMEDCGGMDSSAVSAALRDGKLYAYPMTAGNGYFLYYNKAYLSEEDVKSLDRILEVAAENDKKVSMDFTSGWYMYSFFKGAGLEVESNEDGTTNRCNWNARDTKYTGVDVAEAMLAIAGNKGFLNCADDEFVKGVTDGTIIAGVNGLWNATKVSDAFGENYAACKLPKYTLAGDQVQMCSFMGYKLVGVNAYTAYPEWSMKLAQWLTGEEAQSGYFKVTGECPANVRAAASPEVQASPAVAAIGEQAQYGYTQSVADTFWNPSYIFGVIIGSGNSDNIELQDLLDKMVEDITAPSTLN